MIAVVVEDDPNISELIELYLDREGFRVITAADGERALALIDSERPDIVVLDIGLPGSLDGLDVCRAVSGRVPILFVSARGDEVDRIVGLELGADDYLTKPFSPRELVARVKAILRRGGAAPAPTLTVPPDIEIDPGRREVTAAGAAVELTTREFELLAHLAANQGFVLSRQQLLDGAWGTDWYGDVRTVDVHVAQLRKKLPSLRLATIRGIGYRLS